MKSCSLLLGLNRRKTIGALPALAREYQVTNFEPRLVDEILGRNGRVPTIRSTQLQKSCFVTFCGLNRSGHDAESFFNLCGRVASGISGLGSRLGVALKELLTELALSQEIPLRRLPDKLLDSNLGSH